MDRRPYYKFLLLYILVLIFCSSVDCANAPTGFNATLIDKEGNIFNIFDLKYTYVLGSYLGNSYQDECYIPIEYGDAIISIPFTNINDILFENSTYSDIHVLINLENGSVLDTKVLWLGHAYSDCGFSGKTELSDYFIALENIQRVVFHHDFDLNTAAGFCRPFGAYTFSDYTIDVETWSEDRFTIYNASQFGHYRINNQWFDVRTIINFKQGTADGRVDFKDIKSVKILNKNDGDALINTTSGEMLNVTLPFRYGPPQQILTYCIGGKFGDLGLAGIPLNRIKELEIKI